MQQRKPDEKDDREKARYQQDMETRLIHVKEELEEMRDSVEDCDFEIHINPVMLGALVDIVGEMILDSQE